jgi:hypothetical protein
VLSINGLRPLYGLRNIIHLQVTGIVRLCHCANPMP